MKRALIICMLLFPNQALASPGENYLACLVGNGVIAVDRQPGPKDADAALIEAVSMCQELRPAADNADPDYEFGEEAYVLIEEFAVSVERMAGD